MGLPGSILSNDIPTPSVAKDTGAFPSLATFVAPTYTTAASGQQVRTPYTPVDGAHTNVPCRRSPFIDLRPQQAEFEHPESREQRTAFRLMLIRYFADLDSRWEVIVDGVTYQIEAIENDGNTTQSRLKITLPQPFVQ